MRKASGEVCVLLLLACITAASASAKDADFNKSVFPDPAESLRLFRQLIGDPNVEDCWKTLVHTESCISSILHSILEGHFQLNSDCCKAIVGLGENCIPKMFTLPPPWGNLIPNMIKAACAALPPEAQQAQRRTYH